MGNLGNFSLECWILNTLWPGRGEKDPKARKREKQKIEHIKNDLVVGGFPILVIFFGDKNNCHVNNLSSSKDLEEERNWKQDRKKRPRQQRKERGCG